MSSMTLREKFSFDLNGFIILRQVCCCENGEGLCLYLVDEGRERGRMFKREYEIVKIEPAVNNFFMTIFHAI